jgi:molybdopterin-guanine dinucleotide biosynthesis protein A
MDPRTISGIILTGGRSTRMGNDKATLELSGVPMWRHVASVLQPFVDRILLVGAIDDLMADPPITIVPDNPPGLGPLGGLATGLEKSGKTHHLVVATDYPLIRPDLLDLLLRRSPGRMAVCGQSGQLLEPLIGYYHSSCAPVARAMLAEGEVRTYRLIERVTSYVLSDSEYERADPGRLSQINVNTPADLRLVAEIMQREAGQSQ